MARPEKLNSNAVNKKKVSVGVVAGTPIDTMLGLRLLNAHGIDAVGSPMSDSPQEQTYLQAMSTHDLTQKLITEIHNLAEQGVVAIVIYCNSLSGAVDLARVKEEVCLPVFSPIDSYSECAHKHTDVVIATANGQSVAHLEKVFLQHNREIKITGLSLLKVVEDIESGLSAASIIEKHRLALIIQILFNAGSEVIVLGCTHFDYLYDEMTQIFGVDRVFLPATKVVSELKNALGEYR